MKLQRGPREGGKKSGEYTEHVCQESRRGLIEERKGKAGEEGKGEDWEPRISQKEKKTCRMP